MTHDFPQAVDVGAILSGGFISDTFSVIGENAYFFSNFEKSRKIDSVPAKIIFKSSREGVNRS